MKLKPVAIKPTAPAKATTTSKKSEEKKSSKLPPDTYKPVLDKDVELQISDTSKLVFSVSRKGDDGTPHLDIRLHVTSPTYTGLTQKGINFDTEYLYDFMEIVDKINTQLEKKGL